jgi:hypothetical protein
MASDSERNWWEHDLEFSLAGVHGTLAAGQRLLKNIPNTIQQHKLGKFSPMDGIEPDPVEKIKAQEQAQKNTGPRMPKPMPEPPKPECLERKEAQRKELERKAQEEQLQLATSQTIRAVNLPSRIPVKKVTLENLLDPDFCEY